MGLHLAMLTDPGWAGLFVAVISCAMVWICLDAISRDIKYSMRCEKLKAEAQSLRRQHLERLQELNLKPRRP